MGALSTPRLATDRGRRSGILGLLDDDGIERDTFLPRPRTRWRRLTSVLVAGAGGYVGGRLVEILKGDGCDVRAAVLRPSPRPLIDEVVVDLAADLKPVRDACRGASVIVHLAGANEVVAAQDPGAALASTVLATLRLGEAAVTAGSRRLVYLSTVHVYGDRMQEGALLAEEMRPEPRSVYAIARLASEHLLAGFAARGIEVVVFRLTNAVGAPSHPAVDRWSLVANDLCRQGAIGGELELRTAGVQWRDFISVTDVCSIVAAACRSGEQEALPAGVYNLGSGAAVTIRDLAGLVQDAFERRTGTRPPLRAPAPPPKLPRPYDVSVQRLSHRGLAATTPLRDAVDETVRFCLRHRDELVTAGRTQR